MYGSTNMSKYNTQYCLKAQTCQNATLVTAGNWKHKQQDGQSIKPLVT